MSETAQTTPAAPVAAPGSAESHLAGLHSMSRTAGLTNQEYVAVNGLAIVSLLLSLAALLLWLALEFSFLGLLLILPLAGIVCAIYAIRQINDSNQTQTGKIVAWSGLVIGVLCAVGSIGLEVKERNSASKDERAIAQTISDIGKHVKAGEFDKAYALFDPRFQAKWSLTDFKRVWDGIQGNARVGKLEKFEWNQMPPQYIGDADGAPTMLTKAVGKFQGTGDDRFDLQLRKEGDQWLVTEFASLFPERRKANPASQFNL